MTLRIGIAADHAGKELKQLVGEFIRMKSFELVDYGIDVQSEKSVDYPDYAAIVAEAVNTGKVDRGVLICGTGIGMCIAANKFPGIRAALITDEYMARMSRAHNDANIICLGSRVLNPHRATDLLNIWLDTAFEGHRHQGRIDKIRNFERRLMQR
jgi:ribose 5-phosphate isomerase B